MFIKSKEGTHMEIEKNEKVTIRRADRDNAKRVWEIRNHPEVRKWSMSPQDISLEDHMKWFEAQYCAEGENRCYVILDDAGLAIGYCRYDFQEASKSYRVSIAIDPGHHQHGQGTLLLQQTLNLFSSGTKFHAEIEVGNDPSLKLFTKCGFVIQSTDDKYHHCSLESNNSR